MALMKCPDCGRNVSDKAYNCPECGCPSKYFINESVSGKNSNAVESTKGEADKLVSEASDNQVNKEIVEEEMIVFTFGDYVIQYRKSDELYANLYGTTVQVAREAVDAITKTYVEAGDIRKITSTVIPAGQKALDMYIEEIVRQLFDLGISTSVAEFKKKYMVDYDFDYLDKCKFIKALENQSYELEEELRRQEAVIKASRGRWEGGGFGLSGAIKGAMTASVLNAGSDFLHSFGDASRAANNRRLVEQDLRSTYNAANVKEAVCSGLGKCILNASSAYSRMLEKLGKLTIPELNSSEAETLFENANKYLEVGSEKYIRSVFECIAKCPATKKYYDAVIPYIITRNTDDFSEFLKFWNLTFMYPDYEEERKKAVIFDSTWEKIMQTENDFTEDCSPESYVMTRKFCNNYFDDYGVETLPKYSFFAQSLKDYYERICEENPDIFAKFAVIDWIPLDSSIEDFFMYIRRERDAFPNTYLKYTWLLGDNPFYLTQESGISKKSLINELSDIILYLDISVDSDGTKGLVVTKTEMVELGRNLRIPISDIIKISHCEDAAIAIDTEYGFLYILSEDYMTLQGSRYLQLLLIIICLRFCNANEKLWNDKIPFTPKPLAIEKHMSDEETMFVSKLQFALKSISFGVEDFPKMIFSGEELKVSYDRVFYKELQQNVKNINSVCEWKKDLFSGKYKLSDIFGRNVATKSKETIAVLDAIFYARGLLDIKTYQERVTRMGYTFKEIGVSVESNNSVQIEAATTKSDNKIEHKMVAEERMFCPYCGKSILRTTKFCNFCGKGNSYQK